MDDPAVVCILDHAGKGGRQAGRFEGRNWLAAEPVGEAAAFHKFQAQVGYAQVLAHVMNHHDMRMPEAGDHRRLGPQPGDRSRRRVDPCREHLERDQPIELDLSRLVDDPRTAAAQNALDLEALDLARNGRQIVRNVVFTGLGSAVADGRKCAAKFPQPAPPFGLDWIAGVFDDLATERAVRKVHRDFVARLWVKRLVEVMMQQRSRGDSRLAPSDDDSLISVCRFQPLDLALQHFLNLAPGDVDHPLVHLERLGRLDNCSPFENSEHKRLPVVRSDAGLYDCHGPFEQFQVESLIEPCDQVFACFLVCQQLDDPSIARAPRWLMPSFSVIVMQGMDHDGPKPAAKAAQRVIRKGLKRGDKLG